MFMAGNSTSKTSNNRILALIQDVYIYIWEFNGFAPRGARG
tara:strand:+ start:229 stop:351 length:123 start_codon:yes stop_codon:yes gene_type:complete